MKNVEISLLWPENKKNVKQKTLGAAAISDLNLDGFCEHFTKDGSQCKMVKDILVNMVYDEETIKYRQDIFEDMISSKELTNAFEEILGQIEALENTNVQPGVFEEAKLWFLFSRFKELEVFVDCITTITDLLTKMELKSQGLLTFRNKMQELLRDPDFVSLSKMVKSINIDIDQIQSITLGINLDSSLNPSEATIISVNSTRFKENSFIKEVIDAVSDGKFKDLRSPSKIHKISGDKRDAMLYVLYKDIERYLKPVVRDLSQGLNRYRHVYTRDIVNLIPELNFYISFVRLYNTLEEYGMPTCRASILNTSDRKCDISGIYSLSLALHMIERKENPVKTIVLNRAIFDDDGRILIITGPNRGGKTVYTEAVGLAFVLFQAGVFVPGTKAEISPADNIFTHFPVDENKTVELGRLGEEASRLNIIFKEATRDSLILLNESLTSTSYSEGLYLAQGIVKALSYLGARAIFNTHLHELAQDINTLNIKAHGDSKIRSLVAGISDGKRSYVVKPGAPLGKSYAMDIAVKFGVSYDQLVESINSRNN